MWLITKTSVLLFLYVGFYVGNHDALSRTGLELHLLPTRYDFKESLEKCRQLGMILAQPKTKELVDFSTLFLRTTVFSPPRTSWVWVDLRRESRDSGSWKWGDNSVFDLINEWTTGEPSNGVDEGCAGLRATGFFDNACSLPRHSLCQRTIPSVGKVFSVDYHNVIPVSKTMASTAVSSKLHCFLQCLQTKNCESCVVKIDINTNRFHCLLYDRVYNDKDMTPQEDTEYYVKYFPHN